MGSNEGEKIGDCEESLRISNSKPYFVIFLCSLLISIAGGSVLGWWLYKYHPSNSQLWMVPFGLIFFLTPLIVWFSLIISDLCVSKKDEEEACKMNQRIHPLDDSLSDPKRSSFGV